MARSMKNVNGQTYGLEIPGYIGPMGPYNIRMDASGSMGGSNGKY